MTLPGEMPPDVLADARLAARLCAIDPVGLGGMSLRGGGELRDAVIANLVAAMPLGAPIRRLPAHIDEERLLGGLDLGATLSTGKAVSRVGLLAEAAGGIVVIPMAERLSDSVAAPIAAAMDTGEVVAEREGMTLRSESRFLVVALDDASEADERPPASLRERMAFWFDLSAVELSRVDLRAALQEVAVAAAPVARSHAVALEQVIPPADVLEALAVTAAVLGVDSIRAPLFALRAARASAILDGRMAISEADVALAARLVLGPRATRMPPPPEAEPEDAEPEAPEPPPPPPPDSDSANDSESSEPKPLDDVVLEAVLASLPKDVLAKLATQNARRGPQSRTQGRGEKRRSTTRGRPVGVRAGIPRGGLRLSLIDTLRAAAPWQRVRGAQSGQVKVRKDDLRIRRFESRTEATTIFAVDASGSSALARLAEAKGAVELLLAEAYVKRAQVALVAFRGQTSEIILPPTRSLARAKKSLSALPGGGGTPLAAGLNTARELAEVARSRGRTPFLVILTDGRANIAADGTTVRQRAEDDARPPPARLVLLVSPRPLSIRRNAPGQRVQNSPLSWARVICRYHGRMPAPCMQR